MTSQMAAMPGAKPELTKAPKNGVLTQTSPTTWLFTPNSNFCTLGGNDGFAMTITDSKGNVKVFEKRLVQSKTGDIPLWIRTGLAPSKACANPDQDGKTVGKISVGKSAVDIKRIDYPKSGVLDPPKSPLAAGVSIRHQPLSAIQGSSLIVWHVSYSGCEGKLNTITKTSLDSTFSVVDENGVTTKYKITKNTTVPVGKYDSDWFRLNGSRQLVFVTCAGKVVKGHHTHNQVVVATPV
jgi:hypothetical protein